MVGCRCVSFGDRWGCENREGVGAGIRLSRVETCSPIIALYVYFTTVVFDGTSPTNIKYIYIIFPFQGFVPFMFCFVLRIFMHPFFHMLYVTVISPSWILIQLMHAIKNCGEGGWNLLCCTCQEFILCYHHRSINKIGSVCIM